MATLNGKHTHPNLNALREELENDEPFRDCDNLLHWPDMVSAVETVPHNFTQEVLAEIGRQVMQSAQGRPGPAKAIFEATLPAFRDKYPQHKILAHLCNDAGEAKPVSGVPIPPDLLE